jgi:hypothetical protein
MDKWFKYINEVRTEDVSRKSAAGIKKSIKALTQQGGNEGGNPTGMKKVEDPLEDKDNEKKISAPPGAPGGGAVGNPGPALEEDSARDQRPQPEPSQVNATKAQRQYKAQRRKNDIYSSPAGHKNLSSGAPFDNKTKRAGTDRLRFEEVEPESFEKNATLEPHLWEGEELKSKVVRRLRKIADDFIEGLDLDIDVIDIRLTGSLANYNWSRYSDVDLHLVVDYSKIDLNAELVKAFFDASRMRWNELHDIRIYGYEVEIYVEDVDDDHRSSGLYSVMRGEWLKKPDPTDVQFDFNLARAKSDDIVTQVNLIDKFAADKPRPALAAIERLKKKIRFMRRAGLQSKQQEYSAENIAFKILRRDEVLDKLNDMKYAAYDTIMTMELK